MMQTIFQQELEGVHEIWCGLEPEGLIVGIVGGGTVAIHSSEQTNFGFIHKKGITQGASEEVDEVAGGSDMGVDWIGEVGDRTS